MKTIYMTFAQISPCSDAEPHGRALEIFYVIEEGIVIVTNEDGKPLRDARGKPVSKKLAAPNEDPRKVAATIGLRHWRSARDEMDDFRRPLSGRDYPPVPA